MVSNFVQFWCVLRHQRLEFRVSFNILSHLKFNFFPSYCVSVDVFVLVFLHVIVRVLLLYIDSISLPYFKESWIFITFSIKRLKCPFPQLSLSPSLSCHKVRFLSLLFLFFYAKSFLQQYICLTLLKKVISNTQLKKWLYRCI